VIPHALAVAQSFVVPVTLLRVIGAAATGDRPPDPLEWDIRRHEARDYLERHAAVWRQSEVSIGIEVIEGRPAEEICAWARRHGVDLTVVASHGVSGVTEWSLANTARKLCEGVPGSLLLVPAAAPAISGVARYRRILVPLDGSARAESVLPVAAQLARHGDGEVLLAHVVPVPELTEIGVLDAEDLALRERLMQRNQRVAREYLERLRNRLAADGVSVRATVLRADDVRSRLARLIVDEATDVVVLSAHGRGGRCDLPYGTVSASLLAQSTAPLLMVRPGAAHPPPRAHAAHDANGVRLPSQATS
jgi:nucleotide-binding universal stress UspA family protein